ncbi:MAG: glycosyltransferase family 39 protein, partial [Lentisphaeria bacterium]|nr:glycosyltransferase family 39 protein [Lentisphaeria bacterium]
MSGVMYDPAERTNPLRSQEFFFWLCALVALVSLLGRASFFGSEPVVAEAAREAAEFGRWWPLCVNFRPFPGLSPVEVWSVAAMSFFGGITEFSGRLPAALAALALLCGCRVLAGALFDRGTALLTSWLTLGCCGVIYLGRNSGSGILSAALLVWMAVLRCREPERRRFWNTLASGALLILGVADRGWGFLLLAAALLLPWQGGGRPLRRS